jgi:formyltetrahydrofolate deformylase
LIISNHPDGAALTRFYNMEFRHIPVSPETKLQAEQEQLMERETEERVGESVG